MTCEHNWTIEFLDVNDGDPFEIRPIEMSLKMSRDEYAFCRAKFPWEVGQMMKPHTRYSDGVLYGLTTVNICYNGNPVQKLMFRPDWADYTSDFTHIQFHDLHKALSDGLVDEQRKHIQLKEAYETVLNSASNRLIDKVEFTLPDNQVRTLYGTLATRGGRGKTVAEDDAEEDTAALLDSEYAIDFNQISPENALQRLNKKFGLKSWVNRDGKLIVGLPEANSVHHVAAPRDDRVWRYKNPSISHGREPIKSVVVEGAWEDEPGIGHDIDVFGWFDEGGTADVKAMGVARRTDVDYGTSFSVKSSKAKSDSVDDVARLALKERMKQQNAGSVELDPDLSGEMTSEIIDLSPGDLLQLVPEDEHFDNPDADSGVVGDIADNPDALCGGFVNNAVYLVSDVEHSITMDGDWQVHADLGMYSDVPIESYVSYFDPTDSEWVTDSEIADDGSLADGFFESI